MKDTQIYRWIPASEFKFQEYTLYFAENRMPGEELYKISVEYVNCMSVNGKEFLKNRKQLFWKHLNDWDNLYIMEAIILPDIKETFIEICQRLSGNKNMSDLIPPIILRAVDEYTNEFSTSVPKNEFTEALKKGIPFGEPRLKRCPHCGSVDVIMFDSDNDICQSCDKYFPGT